MRRLVDLHQAKNLFSPAARGLVGKRYFDLFPAPFVLLRSRKTKGKPVIARATWLELLGTALLAACLKPAQHCRGSGRPFLQAASLRGASAGEYHSSKLEPA